jgi:hypothetical protein
VDIKTGDRFVKEDEWLYRDANGQNYHYRKYVVEVTAITKQQAEYKVVEILEERNRPSWLGPEVPMAGLSTGGFSIPLFHRTGFQPYNVDENDEPPFDTPRPLPKKIKGHPIKVKKR